MAPESSGESGSSAASAQRLQRWCKLAADGDAEKFRLRLTWSGLNDRSAHRALAAAGGTAPDPLPEWAEWIRLIAAETRSYRPFPTNGSAEHDAVHELFEATHPLPFEHVFLPVIRVARTRLAGRLAEDPAWNAWSAAHIPTAIWRAIERNLLHELADLAWRPLLADFSRTRPAGLALFDALRPDHEAGRESGLYRAFVAQLLCDDASSWLRRYPVLARLIATRVRFSVDATAELMRRLKTDWEALHQTFGHGSGSSRTLSAITLSLSDSHQNGRTVAALTFSDGSQVVYKPKKLQLAVRYNQFLDWCNATASATAEISPLKSLRTLDRGDYGWVQFADASPCGDKPGAGRYYFRAGELLCIAHVMGGTDLHFENIIANGEDPVLIDVESLFHAHIPADANQQGASSTAINARFWDSVMNTGLLPRWNLNADEGSAFDISGLGCVSPLELRGKVRKWRAINSDAMRVEFGPADDPPQRNVPTVNGRISRLGDHVSECIAGFRAMYRFLIKNRSALLASDIWHGFQGQSVRFIFRPTKVYSALLQKTLEPVLLRQGMDRSLEFEVLNRAILSQAEPERLAPLLMAEIAALESGDIPYFSTNSSSCEAELGFAPQGSLKSPLSAFTRATQRLEEFSDDDLEWQCELIEGAACARMLGELRTQKPITNNTRFTGMDCTGGLSNDEALLQAIRIGDELVERAWDGRGSGLTWLGFSYFPPAGRLQFEPLGVNLYDGVSGVALFLSALSAATRDDRYIITALRAIDLIGEGLDRGDSSMRKRLARRMGIGGLHGLGSVIYSLVRISGFARKPELLELAIRIGGLVEPEQIRECKTTEVMTGTAGTLLALLRLHAVSGDSTIKVRAIECADHLVSSLSVGSELRPTWWSGSKAGVLGFAHGVAGICHALRQAYALTQASEYSRLAIDGDHYLKSLYSEANANWPDLQSGREKDAGTFKVNWCQGAVGIGLATLAAAENPTSAAAEFDLTPVLQMAAMKGIQPLDHVCCGNFGTIEFLLNARRTRAETPALPEAATLAKAVVQRRNRTGGFNLLGTPGKLVYNPGFFQGTAGIGYSLLRIRDASLPCVLLME